LVTNYIITHRPNPSYLLGLVRRSVVALGGLA